mmetsp:Transcript_34162/g.53271  ORF Transcript_34162/g.53271 Transcript_34162/m.53271 type:complete len:181 (+) Transcript_34162:49-591(+)
MRGVLVICLLWSLGAAGCSVDPKPSGISLGCLAESCNLNPQPLGSLTLKPSAAELNGEESMWSLGAEGAQAKERGLEGMGDGGARSSRQVLGCQGVERLRGGGKRRQCSVDGCKQPIMPIAGACDFCPHNYCSNHRLPEDHKCLNLQSCRVEAYNSNFVKLSEGSAGVAVRPESAIRDQS